MPNYNYYNKYAPWFSQRGKIKKEVIQNVVMSIGNTTFSICSDLTSVTFSNSVTII